MFRLRLVGQSKLIEENLECSGVLPEDVHHLGHLLNGLFSHFEQFCRIGFVCQHVKLAGHFRKVADCREVAYGAAQSKTVVSEPKLLVFTGRGRLAHTVAVV